LCYVSSTTTVQFMLLGTVRICDRVRIYNMKHMREEAIQWKHCLFVFILNYLLSKSRHQFLFKRRWGLPRNVRVARFDLRDWDGKEVYNEIVYKTVLFLRELILYLNHEHIYHCMRKNDSERKRSVSLWYLLSIFDDIKVNKVIYK